MTNIAEALATGTRHHRAGQLAEAERLYRQVLEVDPHNAQALHLLGMLALQARQFDTAVALIGQAVAVDGTQAAHYANLGEAHRQLGHDEEAIECLSRAVQLQPDLAQVHASLGQLLHSAGRLDDAVAALQTALRLRGDQNTTRSLLGHALRDLGKLDDAEACFRRVLLGERDSPAAHFDLGTVLQARGQLDEAADCYRSALRLEPAHADAHTNLGAILQEHNRFDEAEKHFRQALRLEPNRGSAHLNVGTNLQARGQLKAAEDCYRAAIRLGAEGAVAYHALGSVLLQQGDSDGAVEAFAEVLRLEPDRAAGHLNLATAYQAQGRLARAVENLDSVLRIEPDNAEALGNLAMVRNEQGQRDEAVAACRRAIAVRPDYAPPYNNLAVALMALGRMDEAVATARKASELSPADSPHHSNLLYMLNYPAAADPAAIAKEHRAWAARHADTITAKSPPHDNDRAPDRRLRVGYVSGHFMAHAVNFFTEPILASHDKSQVEVFCYAHVPRPDETTDRLKSYADHWRDIATLSDAQVAKLVRKDRIDILVDLAGHIGGNRLLVFAHKPAPVQMTYIGYQATTGLAAMDYRLTDEWSDPPGVTDAFHTETLLRLPRCFFCYQPSPDAPPIIELPRADNGYITFGSFNAFGKVTPEVLATWATLLAEVPNAKLTILADAAPSQQAYLNDIFQREGIDAQRITLANRRPRAEYLELIQQADIALDPFPFNGHTTTCDCLWQGVPVVALAGNHYASRFGSSAHQHVELQDLVAQTPQQYVETAARLAADVGRLAKLRQELRPRMAASPLVDYVGFTRNLEAAYRQAWQDWCAQSGTGEARS